MSSWVLAWSWRQAGLSDGAHLLLCYMADQADDYGVVGLLRSVSRPALAELFGVSVDTIDRRVRELVNAALMEVEKRSRPGPHGGATSITNVYRLQSPAPPEAQGRKSAALADEPGPQTQGRNPAPLENPGPQVAQESAPDAARVAAIVRLPPPQMTPEPAPDAARVAATVAAPISLPPSSFLPVGDPAIPRLTMSRKADWLLYAVNDPLLDTSKSAALITGASQVDRWVTSGADLEQVVLPVILGELQKRRQNAKGPIKSWGLLTDDVRAAAVRFLKPLENYAAQAMEQANGGSGDGGGGRGESRPHAGAHRQSGGSQPDGILGALKRRNGGSG